MATVGNSVGSSFGERYWETNPPRPGVFLCFRWVDSMAAVALDNLLIPTYGEGNVFRSDRSLREGEPFKRVLNDAVLRSRAMIAIIGLNWARSLKQGQHEWALYEVLQAQDNRVPILPVYLTRTHYLHEETGSTLWETTERPLESLSPSDLPDGIRPDFLEAEQVTFGTSGSRKEVQSIVKALGRLADSL